MSEMKVNAYFEPADNLPVELDAENTTVTVDFGVESRITAISASHGNDDYVVIRLRKKEDTKPFWENKFFPGLNGQVFIQPIPKLPVREVVVEVEPKAGTSITDSVIVNISYI